MSDDKTKDDKRKDDDANDANDAIAEELAQLRADIAEANIKREAAEKLSRKVSADLQRLQTQRKATDAGMTEEKLAQLREEAKQEVLSELKPQLERATQLEAQNRTLLLDSEMQGRALKLGVLPTKIKDFWKLRADEFDLTSDGKPMVRGKAGIDPDRHLAQLLKLTPEWVAGSQADGSGKIGGTGGKADASQFDALSGSARLAAAHEAGLKE